MDMSLIDAILLLGYGPDANQRPPISNPPLQEYSQILKTIKTAHRARELIIWGKPEGGASYKIIPPDYWDTHNIDIVTICWDDISRFKAAPKPSTPTNQRTTYTHLMTNRARAQGIFLDKGRLIRK